MFNLGQGDMLNPGQGDMLNPGQGDMLNPGQGDMLNPGQGDMLNPGQGDMLNPGQGDMLNPGQGDMLNPGQGDMPILGDSDLWQRLLNVFLRGNITDNAVKIVKWLLFAALAYTLIGSVLVYSMQYNGEQVDLGPLSFRFSKYNMTSCESDGTLKGRKDDIYQEYGWIPNTGIFWKSKEIRLQNKFLLEMLCEEADLVNTLDRFNIVKCAHSWIDEEGNRINMLAEYFPSGYGNPEAYAAIKSMCREIQNGVMHVSNVHCYYRDRDTYIIEKTGSMVLGNFGFVIFFEQGTCHQKKSGSYSFVGCLLEMVTLYHPCSQGEFSSLNEANIEPFLLTKVAASEVSLSIRKCMSSSQYSLAVYR